MRKANKTKRTNKKQKVAGTIKLETRVQAAKQRDKQREKTAKFRMIADWLTCNGKEVLFQVAKRNRVRFSSRDLINWSHLPEKEVDAACWELRCCSVFTLDSYVVTDLGSNSVFKIRTKTGKRLAKEIMLMVKKKTVNKRSGKQEQVIPESYFEVATQSRNEEQKKRKQQEQQQEQSNTTDTENQNEIKGDITMAQTTKKTNAKAAKKTNAKAAKKTNAKAAKKTNGTQGRTAKYDASTPIKILVKLPAGKGAKVDEAIAELGFRAGTFRSDFVKQLVAKKPKTYGDFTAMDKRCTVYWADILQEKGIIKLG